MASILIVEDEALLARELRRFLQDAGHDVRTAATGEEGVAAARAEPPDLVLLDLRLPDAVGHDVLDRLRADDPELPVVLMTAYGSIRDAVDAIRRGAADYVQKPLDLDEVALLVERILKGRRRERELVYLRERGRIAPSGVVGDEPRLLAIFEQVQRLADAGLRPGERPAILLVGETGTGKGIVARSLHGVLGGGPFVEINCAAMPASLVEAELFGHERGTFTDARSSRPGLFEAADGGTIFLDEIGELEPGVQAKFLKVIEEKRVRRLGAVRDRPLDVQVLAATNSDLDRAVAEARFRSDLLHRLRVLSFEVPPLRERKDDVLRLARHFCDELGRRYRRRTVTLSADAERALCAYAWPGNVRELRNVLERAVLLARQDELGVADLTGLLLAAGAPPAVNVGFTLPAEGVDLEALDRDLLCQALERAEGNRTRAAALLGLTRDTIRYRIEKYGLS